MKGSAKKKSGSELPIDTSGDGEAAINGVADSLAPSAEKYSSGFLQKGEEGEDNPLQDSEAEDEEGAEEEEDEEEVGQGSKPEDDFYEVEAIRRKRMRKGELQYLVKWSGWPESANTWEPLENLRSVPEIVDAFEESMRSGGKHKKRKRSHMVQHTQIKKRLERSATSYSLRRFFPRVVDKHVQSAPPKVIDPSTPDIPSHPHTVIFADDGENSENVESGFVNVSKKSVERNEEPDYDPKLSELKATTINGYDADKVAENYQEAKTSTGNGQYKVDSGEPGQSDRCRGAKRRKSGSVKRFKMDSQSGEPVVDAQDAMSNGNNRDRNLNDADTIIKLLRPVGYKATIVNGNEHNIWLTFLALRNDGAKVMVDNKYLKLNYPNLLIDFYERHLRYSPTPSSD